MNMTIGQKNKTIKTKITKLRIQLIYQVYKIGEIKGEHFFNNMYVFCIFCRWKMGLMGGLQQAAKKLNVESVSNKFKL